MWYYFEIFALISVIMWSVALVFTVWQKSKTIKLISEVLSLGGFISLLVFIILLWINLDRPPMRTLGETRLWYSFFLFLIGYVVYKRWNYPWFLSYSLFLALVFIVLNWLKPEAHSTTLMPALQSIWFVPHVIVYMIAYAFLGVSSLIGFKALVEHSKGRPVKLLLDFGDNIVYLGFGFLTLGLVFGALWAKEAWGHYWTWDPKETWAFISWAVYMIYMHMRYHRPQKETFHIRMLAFAFIILLIAWFGINYLPAAQTSVHVYS
ncbi:MAG: cytochrome c biogenesis protein CcsA [Salinivirgaceae bacterium]|jgi:ABC-type transport system involved in cytochrome c biogenesis permease subunit|nr:cytochrome c biogenesis protein CcsA [Salinivirgaceae bacterium]